MNIGLLVFSGHKQNIDNIGDGSIIKLLPLKYR